MNWFIKKGLQSILAKLWGMKKKLSGAWAARQVT